MCDYKMEKKDEASLSVTIFCQAGLSFRSRKLIEGSNNTDVPGNFFNSALDKPMGSI